MKILRMISKTKYEIKDDEAENIKKMWAKDTKTPILLRNNTMINPACIESVGEVGERDLIPYFMGSRMNKTKSKVLVAGEWKSFAGNPREIEMRSEIQRDEIMIEDK